VAGVRGFQNQNLEAPPQTPLLFLEEKKQKNFDKGQNSKLE
jgi:hypothetical protein